MGELKMENSLTQFSIYKIDYDCFKNIDGLDDTAEEFPVEVRKIIMTDIRSDLSKKKGRSIGSSVKKRLPGLFTGQSISSLEKCGNGIIGREDSSG